MRPKYWDDEKAAWDLYAAHALAFVVPTHVQSEGLSDVAYRASKAADFADAMLAERRKRLESE